MQSNKFLRLALIVFFIYFSLAALLFVFQRSLLYLPSAEYAHDYEQITLTTEGANIRVIVLNAGKPSALLYFGGNAEAVVFNAQAMSTNFPNKTIYLVNYRGYGGSSGRPTEAGLFLDALKIFDHFSSAHQNIAVIGRSLGSGVAMYLAANRPVNKVVLVTPFDSILAVAKNQYPIFPIALLLKDKYDSVALANRVTQAVLVIAGGRDSLIPLSHSNNLLAAIGPDNSQILVIEQASHNNITQFAEYYESLNQFLLDEN